MSGVCHNCHPVTPGILSNFRTRLRRSLSAFHRTKDIPCDGVTSVSARLLPYLSARPRRSGHPPCDGVTSVTASFPFKSGEP